MQRRRYRRLGPQNQQCGRIRWKLWELLREAGLTIVAADQLWVQTGGYRSRYWDLARWGGDWHMPPLTKGCSPMPYNCYSWDTMTNCVRYGITVVPDGPCTWEVHAKSPPVKKAT